MQDPPSAAELLRDIADLLEDEIVRELAGRPSQHGARVAGNLARIVQRELELGPAASDREHAALRRLLGRDGTIEELNAELAMRIKRRETNDPNTWADTWAVVLAVVKDKLAIVKPGHDDYEFANE